MAKKRAKVQSLAGKTDTQPVVQEYLDKFPDTATLTLAKLAYTENPTVWKSVEVCRSAFRYARGNCGKDNRGKLTDTSHVRKPRTPGDAFGAVPEGMTQITDFTPHVIAEGGRALIIADPHIPYHDRTTLGLAWDAHKDVDHVILLGDVMDCFSVSKWETDPRDRNFAEELDVGITMLSAFRDMWPKATITYKMGNHDERYESYMICKAAELLGVEKFRLEVVLELEQNDITIVTDKRPMLLGKLYLVHGHEFKGYPTSPVNPARTLFTRTHTSALVAHSHQTSQHSEKSLDGHVISCWSVGCACELHPLYMPINKWNHGVAYIDVDDKGGYRVQNYRVIEGELW